MRKVDWIYYCTRCLYSTDINDNMCKECREESAEKSTSNPTPCFNTSDKGCNK